MSQGSDARGHRPDPIERQGIDREAAKGGQDLDSVGLSVSVGVFPQRHVSLPVPPVLDRPPVSEVTQQGLGSGPQTRDGVAGLIRRNPITDAMAAHDDDRGAARPGLHHPSGAGMARRVQVMLTWPPETDPAPMRASRPARLGQEKPHETQAPRPGTAHPQAAHR